LKYLTQLSLRKRFASSVRSVGWLSGKTTKLRTCILVLIAVQPLTLCVPLGKPLVPNLFSCLANSKNTLSSPQTLLTYYGSVSGDGCKNQIR
jgi:hypothetical protein